MGRVKYSSLRQTARDVETIDGDKIDSLRAEDNGTLYGTANTRPWYQKVAMCWETERLQDLGLPLCLHGIVQYHVLFGQFQQHRVVEKLADAYVFA